MKLLSHPLLQKCLVAKRIHPVVDFWYFSKRHLFRQHFRFDANQSWSPDWNWIWNWTAELRIRIKFYTTDSSFSDFGIGIKFHKADSNFSDNKMDSIRNRYLPWDINFNCAIKITYLELLASILHILRFLHRLWKYSAHECKTRCLTV